MDAASPRRIVRNSADAPNVDVYIDGELIGAPVLEDLRETAGEGTLLITVVHGAPSAPDVDVYLTPGTRNISGLVSTVTNLAFTNASKYLAVPSGAYRAFVTPAGTMDIVIEFGMQDFGSNVNFSVIAVDAKGVGAPFGLKVLADAVNMHDGTDYNTILDCLHQYLETEPSSFSDSLLKLSEH